MTLFKAGWQDTSPQAGSGGFKFSKILQILHMYILQFNKQKGIYYIHLPINGHISESCMKAMLNLQAKAKNRLSRSCIQDTVVN